MEKSTAATPSARERFNQKLLGYSVTAGAALVLAPAGYAQTYNLTSFQLNGTGGFSTTGPVFGNIATTGAAFFNFTAATSHGAHGQLFTVSRVVHPTNLGLFDMSANQGKIIASTGIRHLAKNFSSHVVVAGTLEARGELALRGRNTFNFDEGSFNPSGAGAQKSGYVGFKTNGGDYGWLKVQVTNNSEGNPAVLAFEKGSDGLFGQIGPAGVETNGVSAIPEPTTVASGLGLLALGAAGVREMRRRRLVVA